MVGALVSFWDGLFSGAMLVSGSVHILQEFPTKKWNLQIWRWNFGVPQELEMWTILRRCLPKMEDELRAFLKDEMLSDLMLIYPLLSHLMLGIWEWVFCFFFFLTLLCCVSLLSLTLSFLFCFLLFFFPIFLLSVTFSFYNCRNFLCLRNSDVSQYNFLWL